MIVTGNNIDILGNEVSNTLAGGIRCGYKTGKGEVKSVTNANVSYNHVHEIGLIPGLGESGENGGTGIHFQLKSEDCICDYNLVENTGYCGLSIYLKNSKVRKNVVRNTCLTLDDGGGIYAFGDASNGTEIAYNYVNHVPGNDQGVRTGKKNKFPANGIYMDGNTHSNYIHHNTVIDAGKSGIFINIPTP